jgi:RNA-directed DNA polymerase
VSHSTQTLNPSGGVRCRRGLTKPALHDNLMVRVVARENMQRAWKRVQANRGAPGMDGMTVEEFPAFARVHWSAIRQALLEKVGRVPRCATCWRWEPTVGRRS